MAARPVPAAKRAARRIWVRRRPLAILVVLAAVATVWWNLRPAVLHIDPWPGGEILIDGVLVGTGPLVEHRVPPGEHEILVRCDGFKEYRAIVKLDPGGSMPLNPRLAAIERTDPRVLKAWEERTGLTLLETGIEASRAEEGFDGPVLPLRPRGKVRRVDLGDVCAAQLADPIAGRIVFLDDAGSEIFGAAIDHAMRDFEFELPAKLLAKLEEGKSYTWGFELGSGQRVLVPFEIVPDLAPDVLAELRARFPDGDSQLAGLFEIALLQREGLELAALRAALRLGDDWPQTVVYGLAWRSLEKLGLEKSSAAAEIWRRYVDASD